MRCFLAVEIPEEVREELARIQKQLPEAKFKLVEPENLHLTLKFLGELSDFQVNQVKEALNKVTFKKFKASLGMLGVFPSSSFVRVIWVSMEPSAKVKELHEQVDSVLEKEKFRRDREFESHITLARVKFIKNKEEFSKKLKEIRIKPLEFSTESFVLRKSELTSQGPIYKTIKEYILH